MQIVFYFLALMSALVAALPAVRSTPGRGATIFTGQNSSGSSTAIPGISFCADLTNLYGNFDGKVRSLTVEAGYRCQFYTTYGCPANGQKLDITGAQQDGQLSNVFDYNIHSVICAQV